MNYLGRVTLLPAKCRDGTPFTSGADRTTTYTLDPAGNITFEDAPDTGADVTSTYAHGRLQQRGSVTFTYCQPSRNPWLSRISVT